MTSVRKHLPCVLLACVMTVAAANRALPAATMPDDFIRNGTPSSDPGKNATPQQKSTTKTTAPPNGQGVETDKKDASRPPSQPAGKPPGAEHSTQRIADQLFLPISTVNYAGLKFTFHPVSLSASSNRWLVLCLTVENTTARDVSFILTHPVVLTDYNGSNHTFNSSPLTGLTYNPNSPDSIARKFSDQFTVIGANSKTTGRLSFYADNFPAKPIDSAFSFQAKCFVVSGNTPSVFTISAGSLPLIILR